MVVIEAVSATKLNVTWMEPTRVVGVLESYNVYYKSKDESDYSTSIRTSGPVTHLVVDGLEADTVYDIQVTANTKDTDGTTAESEFSDVVSHRTLEGGSSPGNTVVIVTVVVLVLLLILVIVIIVVIVIVVRRKMKTTAENVPGETDDNYTELTGVRNQHIYTGLQRNTTTGDDSQVNESYANGDQSGSMDEDKHDYDEIEK
ncbi:uncharacterized protein LOC144436212 [Glandiceps talaboti]